MTVSSILLKGLVTALVVGFITGSIKSWVDRFFLVIMLIAVVGFPIQEAVTINLIVVSMAAVMLALRQSAVLRDVRQDWTLIVIPAVVGAALGRVIALSISARYLTILLGVYAILAGVRLAFIRPMPEKETKAHPTWLAPIAFGSALLTGLLSAGGKVFKIPLYNMMLGRHPQQAYALGALGVSVAAPVALFTQISMGVSLTSTQLLTALYLFTLITAVSLVIQRYWTQRLGKWVTLTIAPILVLVGIRFLMMVL